MKISKLILKIILLAGLIFLDNKIYSQGKFQISTGIGFPDMTNIKIRYGNNIQIGASFGFFNNFRERFDPILIEIYFHCAGKSKFIEQRPWYLLVALGYDRSQYSESNRYWLLTRFGRSINFSNRIGLNLDVGAFFSHDSVLPIGPSGSISFFVRL
jgi:hypothetical protein